MERRVDDKNILEEFLEDFVRVVERHAKYIIVSGFVAIAHGRSRGTEDIDMIIEKLSKDKFINLHNDLLKAGFECMQSDKREVIFDDYLNRKDSVRYIRENIPLPEMEIKFAKDELDEMQIKERIKIPFTGLNVWFSSIEMNIAFKEELLKSEKDMEDAKHLRLIYENKLNENKINEIKAKIKKLRIEKWGKNETR